MAANVRHDSRVHLIAGSAICSRAQSDALHTICAGSMPISAIRPEPGPSRGGLSRVVAPLPSLIHCSHVLPTTIPAHTGDAGADQGLVADDLERQADQDRREGREPRPLCYLPDGGGRHRTANVPGDFAARCRAAAEAAARASMRRPNGYAFNSARRADCAQMTRKNRQLRPKNATSEAGLQATGHKRADPFREAQKVAIIRHTFGVHLGNPVQ